MKKVTAILILMLVFACQHSTPATREETETMLKKAMTDYLYKQVKYDSSLVKYHVLEVVFFEEKKVYLCNFKVHETDARVDTTGFMGATITKDSLIVTRTRPR